MAMAGDLVFHQRTASSDITEEEGSCNSLI
jgi:hypothetical protein